MLMVGAEDFGTPPRDQSNSDSGCIFAIILIFARKHVTYVYSKCMMPFLSTLPRPQFVMYEWCRRLLVHLWLRSDLASAPLISYLRAVDTFNSIMPSTERRPL